jgi:hypothetical protein
MAMGVIHTANISAVEAFLSSLGDKAPKWMHEPEAKAMLCALLPFLVLLSTQAAPGYVPSCTKVARGAELGIMDAGRELSVAGTQRLMTNLMPLFSAYSNAADIASGTANP